MINQLIADTTYSLIHYITLFAAQDRFLSLYNLSETHLFPCFYNWNTFIPFSEEI